MKKLDKNIATGKLE